MSARPSPGPSAPRHKHKQHTQGIAAGAEDAKYQAKYKDLKRKVKDIEADNDKLQFKVLQAKRGIQRMKLERAILYERLSGVESQNRPPIHPTAPVPPPFSRSHSGGSRHYQDIEPPNPDYGHPMSHIHSPPVPGDPSRHLQHMPSLPPPPSAHRSHASPTMHHSHAAGSSHGRTRSSSRAHQQNYVPNQYPDGMPSVQQVMHSPPIQERERSRRHETHDGPDPHQHGRLSSFMPRHSPPPHELRHVHRMSPGPYMNDPYERQRVDTEREREWERERERERDRRDRDPERDRTSHDLGARSRDPTSMVSPSMGHRNRQPPPSDRGDYPEPPIQSRLRDEPAYYRDSASIPAAAGGGGGYPMHSRSGSPVSGSGSGNGPDTRPDSRHYYDAPPPTQQQQQRSFRLRPVNPPNEEMDIVHEDGRGSSSRDRGGGGGGTFPPPEQSRSSLDSRKRGRHDMDVDSDDAAAAAAEGAVYPTGRPAEDRGSKRYHREHRRSVDNQEDGRMGPP